MQNAKFNMPILQISPVPVLCSPTLHFAFCILNSKVLRELPPLLKLAGPVILAEIGWMVMGIVDTMMVGPLGPAAIGAAGLGSGVFTAIAIFGMGLMLGLDALRVAGARRRRRGRMPPLAAQRRLARGDRRVR